MSKTYEVLGKTYEYDELCEAVLLCYSQINKFNLNKKNKLKKSVYDFYFEAMRRYRNDIKAYTK